MSALFPGDSGRTSDWSNKLAGKTLSKCTRSLVDGDNFHSTRCLHRPFVFMDRKLQCSPTQDGYKELKKAG